MSARPVATSANVIFSLKTFLAAMLAYFIAIRFVFFTVFLGGGNGLYRRPSTLGREPFEVRLPARRHHDRRGRDDGHGSQPRSRFRSITVTTISWSPSARSIRTPLRRSPAI